MGLAVLFSVAPYLRGKFIFAHSIATQAAIRFCDIGFSFRSVSKVQICDVIICNPFFEHFLLLIQLSKLPESVSRRTFSEAYTWDALVLMAVK